MPIPLSNLFKNAVRAPDVVLLPDALFFIRAIPVAVGATAADLAAQAGLAIEALAPFPLTQLYYGFYHPPGAPLALLYAAYRKRFTAEQTATWVEADLVIPTFVALLGGEAKPATTLVISTADDLTVLHWQDSHMPAKILTHGFAPDTPAEERARVRDELLRNVGESLKTINVSVAPVPGLPDDDDSFVFRAGDFVSRLPIALADELDVRDKDELALRRQHRARDLMLWRVFLGCAAVIALCLASEFALLGGKVWQKARHAIVAAQSTGVDKIIAAKKLADNVGDLSTNRLMPFEMIELVKSHRPPSVQFLRTTTTGSYTLEIEAQTSAPGDVGGYQTTLTGLSICSKVEVRDQRTRDGISTFTIVVTFKPEAFKPVAS
jgi:hypothetical protein